MRHGLKLVTLLIFILWVFLFVRTDDPAIVAIVVPHHNLVRAERQELLVQAARRVRPKTIYLVSPNHFDNGQGNAITTTRTWNLTGGTYLPNQAVIAALVQRGVVTSDDVPFGREHGIYNVLPDLQTVWPEATVVPIILREQIKKPEVDALLAAMYDACADCLVVASVDFSHYQPEELASIHDVATIRTLKAADEQQIWNVEVDSPASLAVMMGWGRLHQAAAFIEVNHTNSGTIAGNPEVETTTHVFGWYQTRRAQPVAAVTTFMVGAQVSALDARSRQGVDVVATDYAALPVEEQERAVLPILHNNVVVAGEIRTETVRGIVLPVADTAGTVQFARGEARRQILATSPDPARGIFLIKRTK